MRNQYKILAEKYEQVFNEEDWKIDHKQFSLGKGYQKMFRPVRYIDNSFDDPIRRDTFLNWATTKLREELNYDPSISLDEIMYDLEQKAAEDRGISSDEWNYYSDKYPQDAPIREKILLTVAQMLIDKFAKYEAEIVAALQKGSEEAGVNLDI